MAKALQRLVLEYKEERRITGEGRDVVWKH